MAIFEKKEEFIPRQKQKVLNASVGRKFVLILLTGSVVLSFLFWGWGSLREKWPGSVSQTLIKEGGDEGFASSQTKSFFTAEDQLNDLVKNLSGKYGVYVYNLSRKTGYGIESQETFLAASLIKLPVILTLYQEVETGRVSLETKYTLKQADKQIGAGSMQAKSAGTIYTYRQMAELMGKQSDNTAFNVIRKVLGDQKIQETINQLGMTKTSLVKNETTPVDIGLFFRKLYGGSVVTREHREEILDFLTNTIYEDRIPAGVPKDVRVAHKIGNEVGVFSDAGIVFAEKPFVLVIMSKDALEKEAKTVLPEITKAVWEFETK